jgi:hypothetical protein
VAVVNWVQPRVLDSVQIAKLDDQLKGWTSKMKGTGDFASQQTAALLSPP